jgi:hypothetical protein
LFGAAWAGALVYGCSGHKAHPPPIDECPQGLQCNTQTVPSLEAGIAETALGYEGSGIDVIIPDSAPPADTFVPQPDTFVPDTSVADVEDSG